VHDVIAMNAPSLLEPAYLAGWLACFAIRWPWQERWKANAFRDDRSHGVEKLLLAAMFLTMMALPLVQVLTSWLGFADYRLPSWLGAAGIPLFAFAIRLFRRSHRDLAANWSPTLQIRERHELVTTGVYARIRHPMYAAIWLWALAQPLLLQNWIAGPPVLLAFAAMYAYRSRAEERMMVDAFGDAYRAYATRVPRLFPQLPSRG